MTYYPGGKKKIGLEISEKIIQISQNLVDISKIKGYCEPFCGMLGVYQHIPQLLKSQHSKKYKKYNLLAGDRNPYLIKLWKGIQKGWKPPTKCNEKEYYKYKENNSKTLKAIFVGFACAYRGDFRSSFSEERNISLQAKHATEIGKEIKNVKFKTGDYTMYSNLENYIIYCDPPYKGTQNPYLINNKKNNTFEYEKFIEWCKEMSKHNIIFISEYKKPCKESKLIWKKGKEKLYIL
jgi:DNA adenine methylase